MGMRPPAPFPTRVNVEVTNHCNQRCPLCPRQAFTRPLGFMRRELFARIAAECGRHDTVLWLHFLGEPLMHPELAALVGDAKRAGVRSVGLSTNAVLLRPALAAALLAAGLDRLECSMDAIDAPGYRAMRGADHFARATRNVRAFLERKRAGGYGHPLTSIQFMRTPAVEADLRAVVDAWRPYLGPRDFVMTIAPASFGGAIPVEAPVAESTPRPPCAWLGRALVVLQDGTVTMCGADWDAHAPLGHLGRERIADIWRGAEMERRRRAHREGRFAAVAPCATCTDWRLADGHGYVNALAQVDGRDAAAGHGVAQ
jgi:Radical SAM superfamily/Iron-sulfur cluster-binding domain